MYYVFGVSKLRLAAVAAVGVNETKYQLRGPVDVAIHRPTYGRHVSAFIPDDPCNSDDTCGVRLATRRVEQTGRLRG